MRPLESGDPGRVGPYRLLARLGDGGMGTVFLAEGRAGARVALKSIRSGAAHDAGFRARFAREIQAAGMVRSPWVAAVLDAEPGDDGGAPWIATEYVPGPTLHELIARHGPLPGRSAGALGLGLAHALEAVHGAGLVHRDVKPSNVLVTVDGPRLIDFGVARLVDVAATGGLTHTGASVGSPGYMSPEQVLGRRVTPAGDIFCLGGVLVHATTGRLPFPVEEASSPHALMFAVVQNEPRLDDVPEELRDLVASCLAKTPEDRPDGAALLGALERYRAGLDEDATADGGDPWLPGRALAAVARISVRGMARVDLRNSGRGGGENPLPGEPPPGEPPLDGATSADEPASADEPGHAGAPEVPAPAPVPASETVPVPASVDEGGTAPPVPWGPPENSPGVAADPATGSGTPGGDFALIDDDDAGATAGASDTSDTSDTTDSAAPAAQDPAAADLRWSVRGNASVSGSATAGAGAGGGTARSSPSGPPRPSGPPAAAHWDRYPGPARLVPLRSVETALYWLLAVYVGFKLIAVVSYAGFMGTIDEWEAANWAAWADIDVMTEDVTLLLGIEVVLGVALFVVGLIWFWRVRNNAEVFFPGEARYTTGMAVGGWFIPLAWWVIPAQVARDSWYASLPDHSRGRSAGAEARRALDWPGRHFLSWWWVANVVASLAYLALSFTIPAMTEVPDRFAGVVDFGQMSSLAGWTIVLHLLCVPMALTCVFLVRLLSGHQRSRAWYHLGGHSRRAPFRF